jgi:hypothetical protein
VYAGSFLRQRLIVLDSSLTRTPGQFTRILIHELFHFVWLRLGNRARGEYEALIRREVERQVRGESGWSAEWRKDALGASPRRWREYVCESFCDTAAYLYSGSRSAEVTLPVAARETRRRWFTSLVDARGGVLRV